MDNQRKASPGLDPSGAAPYETTYHKGPVILRGDMIPDESTS